MYLEKLEIQGFKSFSDHTELMFNRDLTAIVGPNGSGKSNIADAVRWVLGEQSSKALRGKKAGDVIFAGSDKKGRLGWARVDLFLNNKDRKADVDYEKIIITRKVNRNGESEYLVNNNKVRLLDVQLLLAKANFGQKTYSVIGQGMIDSILVSSAAERKEFFDEATGVRQFQIKKEQSFNKLNGAKSNLEQTAQILSELEPRLRSLTRQVNKLEKREKLEKELNEVQTEYYSYRKNNLNADLKVVRQKYDNAQNEVAELNQQLVELQTELEKAESGSSRQASFEVLQQKLSHAQSELNTLLKEKTILEGQADLKLISTGRSELVWFKKQIQNINNDINRNQLIVDEAQQKFDEQTKDLASLENRRKAVLDEFAKLEDSLLNKNGDISSEEMSTNIDRILAKQQAFQNSFEKVVNIEDLAELQKSASRVTGELVKLSKKIRISKAPNRDEWQVEFNKLLLSKDNLVSEISDARAKLARAETIIEQMNAQVKKDKKELAKLEANVAESNKEAHWQAQSDEMAGAILAKEKEVVDIEEKIKSFNKAEEAKKSTLVEAQKKFRKIQHSFNIKSNELADVKVDLARLETKEQSLNSEIAEEIPNLKLKPVAKLDTDSQRQLMHNLKNQLNVIGGIDQAVVDEYKEVDERYQFLKTQSDDLSAAINSLEKVIKDLDESISKQFDQAFKNINKLFHKNFKKLFSGGKAELILNVTETKLSNDNEDDENEDEEISEQIIKSYGIDIKATPPGKKLSSINMLSGGEKALTSIALISAIIANNPSPFVVLDEVDAALDEANSVRFSEILNELSSKTQFIAITHNRATMHRAKIIYGVTMGDDGVSKLLSINFDKADEIAA